MTAAYRALYSFESALAYHWVCTFIKNCLTNHTCNCRIDTWIWHIFTLVIHGLYFPSVQFIDLPPMSIPFSFEISYSPSNLSFEVATESEPAFALLESSILGALSFSRSSQWHAVLRKCSIFIYILYFFLSVKDSVQGLWFPIEF